MKVAIALFSLVLLMSSLHAEIVGTEDNIEVVEGTAVVVEEIDVELEEIDVMAAPWSCCNRCTCKRSKKEYTCRCHDRSSKRCDPGCKKCIRVGGRPPMYECLDEYKTTNPKSVCKKCPKDSIEVEEDASVVAVEETTATEVVSVVAVEETAATEEEEEITVAGLGAPWPCCNSCSCVKTKVASACHCNDIGPRCYKGCKKCVGVKKLYMCADVYITRDPKGACKKKCPRVYLEQVIFSA